MLVYTQMIDCPEDKTKFEQLYLTYRGLMYNVAFQILHNEHDAEDAVHQAFLSMLKNVGKISQVNCPKTRGYAVIIVERKSIDIIRGRRTLSEEEFDESLFGFSFPLPGDGGLSDAIARLPAQYREVLLLRHTHGYDTREVAELLDVSYEAARKLLYRAKTALKILLEKEGITL